MLRLMRRFIALGIFVSSAGLAGCKSQEEKLCDDKCDCELCSDYQYDVCVYDLDNEQREAEFWGCEDYYDEYIDCQRATWRCEGFDFETSCGPERERFHDCTNR